MVTHDFNTAILEEVAHRPWKLPDSPWVMTQTWNDLLFAHWPLRPSELRDKVPPAFELDLFRRDAWIGVLPFTMTNVAPRGVPSLPWVSEFSELNVRTYVRVSDRPGVYFFSLDAGSALAVRTARLLLNLPYHRASMSAARTNGGITYRSVRDSNYRAEFAASYRPTGPAVVPVEGSLEYFLTERYCLYHQRRNGSPYRLEIHHPPWLLQPAEAQFDRNAMMEVNGLAPLDEHPLLHFTQRQDMVAWAPSALA